MQLSPRGELKSGSRPREQMVTPPPYCHLLPLARQMEGGKAQQGGCTCVGASFPLKDEGTSCPAQFYHPTPASALPCPPSHNSHPDNSFILFCHRKTRFLYLSVDCSVYFFQPKDLSYFLTFQEISKLNGAFICRIRATNLRRREQGDTEV